MCQRDIIIASVTKRGTHEGESTRQAQRRTETQEDQKVIVLFGDAEHTHDEVQVYEEHDELRLSRKRQRDDFPIAWLTDHEHLHLLWPVPYWHIRR